MNKLEHFDVAHILWQQQQRTFLFTNDKHIEHQRSSVTSGDKQFFGSGTETWGSNCGDSSGETRGCQDQPFGGVDSLVDLSLVLGERRIDLDQVEASEAAGFLNHLHQGDSLAKGHASVD